MAETNRRFNIGLKLWSSNDYYVKSALDLYNEGVFDYIELYVDPRSEDQDCQLWQNLNIPFHVHAPHSYSGLNLSLRMNKEKNWALIEKVETFRRALNPDFIIFHPGIEGSLDETIGQLNGIKKDWPVLFQKTILENKPKVGVKGEHCLGASPEEVRTIMHGVGCGFCLDIGHALCYSAWAKLDWENVLNDFIRLSPKVYHLSDGDVSSEIDIHENLGRGNYDLSKIVRMIPGHASLAIETNKKSKENLEDFKKDVFYLRRISH